MDGINKQYIYDNRGKLNGWFVGCDRRLDLRYHLKVCNF